MSVAKPIFERPLSTEASRRQKKGIAVGKTKRSKGTKIMAIADASGLPCCRSHRKRFVSRSKLVEETIDSGFTEYAPNKLIGDKAYDIDDLDQRLFEMWRWLRPIEKGAKNLKPKMDAN